MRAWEKFAKMSFSSPSERDPVTEDGLESVSTRLMSEGVGEVGYFVRLPKAVAAFSFSAVAYYC